MIMAIFWSNVNLERNEKESGKQGGTEQAARKAK